MARVRWQFILLYYGIALAISVPFNTEIIYKWLILPGAALPAWHSWLFVPAAFGPLAAAIVCYRLDRTTSRRIEFFGNNRAASIWVALLPLIIFTVAGYVDGGTHGLLYTLTASCVALLYAFGEEAGWRGYLQDVLASLGARQRYFLVGILWWAWHVRFANLFEWTVFPLIVIASAFVLGHVAEKTRSLLVVASMHSVVMLLTMNGSLSPVFAVAGLTTILGWILVGRLSPTEQHA